MSIFDDDPRYMEGYMDWPSPLEDGYDEKRLKVLEAMGCDKKESKRIANNMDSIFGRKSNEQARENSLKSNIRNSRDNNGSIVRTNAKGTKGRS